MQWTSPKCGILECGCEVDSVMQLTKSCPAHGGEGAVKLERFSLVAAATQRRTNVELSSARAALKQAQVQRQQMHIKLRRKRG